MEKAKEAKLEDEKGNELDTIKLAVVDGISIGDTGLLTLDNLKTALRKIPAVVEETEVNKISGRAPWTVKAISRREYDITQYGQVTESTPRPAGLYNDDGYTPWDKLMENEVVKVWGGGRLSVNKDALNGDLVIIDDGSVTIIGDSVFNGCNGLISVKIPEGVTSIGGNAFNHCSNLTSVKIPKSVTSIGNQAFCYCNSLSSIIIPEGVTSIGSDAFSGCSGLTSINIPEGVTNIGNYAFNGCSGLTSVTIPNSITSIGAIFRYCRSLTSVNIPDSVTIIGSNAFEGCSSLSTIIIPSSVTSIGDMAFYDCNSLRTVNYAGTQEQWNAITIGSGNTKLTGASINYNYVPES